MFRNALSKALKIQRQRTIRHDYICQRRTLMDAKQRPSHSRMFDNKGNYMLQQPLPDTAAVPISNSSYLILLATRALQAGCIVYCVTEYVADITLCEGPSMYPTIQSQGEVILMTKWTVRRLQGGWSGHERQRQAMEQQAAYEEATGRSNEWHDPIVSVTDLPPPSLLECLRDLLFTTSLNVGDVVVLQHPHRKGNVCKRILALPGDQVIHNRGSLLIVPDGHLWVEGDNPNNSSDSRTYGAVPASLVMGRVVLRLWPLRGNAWMKRGGRPRETADQPNSGSSTLPAGYQGEHIITALKK